MELVREVLRHTPFKETVVVDGSEILGAFVGDEGGRKSFITRMALAVEALAKVGSNCPQALHVAYTRALQHRTTYVERTSETHNEDFRPISQAVRQKLIPAVTGREVVNDAMEEVLGLPIRLGGLTLSSPVHSTTHGRGEF